MQTELIIKNLRNIINNDSYPNNGIEMVLKQHNCTSLLDRIGCTEKNSLSTLLSTLAIKERYKQGSTFFKKIENYPYAVIKGATLSQQIYNSPYLRRSGDLDILIRRQDLDSIKASLKDCGFSQSRIVNYKIVPASRTELVFHSTQTHQIVPFIKETGNKLCPFINYDINLSVFWGEYPNSCDMDFVLEETEQTSLIGVQYKKLKPEMEFVSLCLHHYKDMNSIYLLHKNSGINLNLFCDIFYYIKNVKLDIDKLFDISKRLKAKPYIYYCLWHTYKLFQGEFLEPLIEKFETAEGRRLLSTFGLVESERHTWNIDFFDRIFSDDFIERYLPLLSEQDIEKIKINSQLM